LTPAPAPARPETATTAAPAAARPVQGLPDPGERVPPLAWPTVALYVATLALFAAEVAAFAAGVSAWVTVPMGAAVTFLMFSVLHESTHHAVSTHTGLNDLLGRISVPFVAPYAAFSMLKFIHIEHHRNTNEAKDTDPDAWTSEGPWWQLPFRWATIDAWYVVFYGRRLRRRPRREQVAAALTVAAFAGVVVAVVLTGTFTAFAVLVLLPQRIGLTVLAWWFDYLPHHGLTITQREDKYRATRVRVGGEKVLTPLFVYQNYHLVHHLHPSIPFYRYVRAWRRNESAYLDRDAAISTWFGRSLTAEEYRTWRRITDPLEETATGRRVFHPLRVAAVEPLTADSVRITFDVPADLADDYRFTAGQHLTLRARPDGGPEERRTYSICSAADSGVLQVAVRRHDGGLFSTYATTQLAQGDVLDVMTPSGTFGDRPSSEAGGAAHLVAVAAGSGITPVLSVVATELERDPHTRVTLVCAHRSRETEMLADDVDLLQQAHGERLDVVRHYSALDGRLEPAAVAGLVDDPADVAAWYLCGPAELVAALRTTLVDAGVAAERVRTELFTGGSAPAPRADVVGVDAEVVVTLDGRDTTLHLSSTGPTVLEAALDAGVDAPYSCAGGACGTCRAWLVTGEAVMDQNHVLGPDEVRAGDVLACQLRPVTERVHVSFDPRG
jgi:ferredoxin-NADP reductase/fatty acid desaturase